MRSITIKIKEVKSRGKAYIFMKLTLTICIFLLLKYSQTTVIFRVNNRNEQQTTDSLPFNIFTCIMS